MLSLNTKLVLSALGIVAMLTSPAAAQYTHNAATYDDMPGYNGAGGTVGIPVPDGSGGPVLRPVNRSAIYDVMPGSYDVIPGYNANGTTVPIPNPDRYGVQSQR